VRHGINGSVRSVADKTFEIKIDGQGVAPETVRLRDLHEVLHAFEFAMTLVAGRQSDLHLVGIKKSSAGFDLFVDPMAYRAAVKCASAIASRDLSPLPERARESLLEIRSKARNKGWTVKISGSNGMPSAEITPDTDFVTDAIISGISTLTATIVRVGGTPRPTAQLQLPNSDRLTATIATEQLATELAQRLYHRVSVEGEAKWSSADWSIVDFKITGIGPFDDKASLLETINLLRDMSGDIWDDIDPDEYIANLRAESE